MDRWVAGQQDGRAAAEVNEQQESRIRRTRWWTPRLPRGHDDDVISGRDRAGALGGQQGWVVVGVWW